MKKSEIVDLVIKESQQMFDYSKAPKTPWGKADSVHKIETGVTWYGTSGHGGLGVAAGVAARKLSPQARELGEKWGSSIWYEEDVAWAIPFYEHPEWSKKLSQLAGGKDSTKEEMEKTIKRYWPQYFEQDFVEKTKGKHERIQSMPELQVGDKISLIGRRPSEFEIISVGKDYLGRERSVTGGGMNYRIPKATVKKSLGEVVRDNKTIWKRE